VGYGNRQDRIINTAEINGVVAMKTEEQMDWPQDAAEFEVCCGYYKDTELVKRSASGGAASALSEWMISLDGAVFGVMYSRDFKSAHYGCAETPEELAKFRSTKYISAEKKLQTGNDWVSVYAAVAEKLRREQYVLFTGLGCDVAALQKYLQSQNVAADRLYTVDLICHGPTYPEVQKQYVERLEQKFGAQVKSFSVRYKKLGWKPPFVRAEFENGKVFEERFYESDFGYAFQNYSRESCYQCKFKGCNHCADLTLGDYWGCVKGMPEFNPEGVSLFLYRTDKGRELVHALEQAESFVMMPADIHLALEHNPMFYKSRQKDPKRRDAFGRDMEAGGLHYAVTRSSGYSAYRKRKWKRMIRERIPAGLLRILKKSGGK